MVLPDLLEENLEIVFCGTAAGDKSAERQAYYAGRGNMFYMILALCGFTPRVLHPDEYTKLLLYGIGLTDLAKFTHGMDNKLVMTDYDIASFENKIQKYSPKVVCFNGKEAAKVFLQLNKTSQINFGLQDTTINNTKVYVAPSTSFSARKYWDEEHWHNIKLHLK